MTAEIGFAYHLPNNITFMHDDPLATQSSTSGPTATRSFPEALAQCLANQKTITIRQKVSVLESVVAVEICNRYELDFGEVGIGRVVQISTGIQRTVIMGHYPIRLEIHDPQSVPLLRLHRPTYFWLSVLHVDDAEGNPLGTIRRKWSWMGSKVFHIVDNTGSLVAIIRSPLWRIWTFPIYCARHRGVVGTIRKRWSGILKEALTDADDFILTRGDTSAWPAEHQALVLAAVFAIDRQYFEGKRGLGRLLIPLAGRVASSQV